MGASGKTFIAGHRGMVGSALLRALSARGDQQLLVRSRNELDLTRQSEVEAFFADENIDRVYLAAASIHLLELAPEAYWSVATVRCSHVNVGTGTDISIGELAELIATVSGFSGEIEFDASMPDGTPRKLLDVSRSRALGWEAKIGLEEGIRRTYKWMTEHWQEIAAG